MSDVLYKATILKSSPPKLMTLTSNEPTKYIAKDEKGYLGQILKVEKTRDSLFLALIYINEFFLTSQQIKCLDPLEKRNSQ